ncbi:hypothetical protein EOL96_06885 [Candidatus Saccharibacteria bacterium]|nr:hypothetical protein [Candidatus Saccharibacteria bacterium]
MVPQYTNKHKGIKPYDLFISAVTVLSLVNLLLYLVVGDKEILYVVFIMDLLISVFFFIDFAQRLMNAENKREYFVKGFGWADMLASTPFPQFKLLRIIRLIKAYRLIQLAGGRQLVREFRENRATGALFIVFFMIILLLEFGSIAVLFAEMSSPVANIQTASDAI